MILLRTEDPRQLLYRELGAGGKYSASQVTEFRFEHPQAEGGNIPLTQPELATLCEMCSNIAYGRNLEVMRSYPEKSWGREQARCLEQKLIPSGLLEIDPDAQSNSVYRLSEMARRGRYVAVVDERKGSD